MEKQAQQEKEKAPTEKAKGGDGDAMRLLVGSALGGTAGYLLTRFGFGSKDLPLGLLGAGAGAAAGGALAHGLNTQAAAEKEKIEQALAAAEAAKRQSHGAGGMGGFFRWHLPIASEPDLGSAAGAVRRTMTPLAGILGALAYHSERPSRLMLNAAIPYRKPILRSGQIVGPKPMKPGAGRLRRHRAGAAGIVAGTTLALSEVLRHLIGQYGEQNAADLTGQNK
jgi:hypothetical protein